MEEEKKSLSQIQKELRQTNLELINDEVKIDIPVWMQKEFLRSKMLYSKRNALQAI